MSGFSFLRAGGRAILASIILTCLFAAGVATGLWFYPQVMASTEADDHDHHDDPHAAEMHSDAESHEEGDHVTLTKQAFENLQLRMGQPTVGDYWKSLLVPGKVVEIPGRSDLAVSTPVAGVIESIEVIPGQNIPMQSPLFTIRLTDEALLAAQAKYLETLTALEVAQQEVDRLTPLSESGAVSGAKKRELEYEIKQLFARQTTILQELRGRGMPEPMIEELREKRTLASTMSVFAPNFVRQSVGDEAASNGYSVENLLVHPGKSIARGESLCTVAYHENLYIEGTAFEVDLPTLQRIAKEEWNIAAELTDSLDHESTDAILQLQLLRVDNHVDDATQTVRFFVELPNEVTQTLTENDRRFEQWRFRPGQRLHLRLPVERWENQITLSTDAVVVDGPNAIVFVEHRHEEDATHDDHDHDHDHAHDHDHDHGDDIFIELEPIPVRMLHRDDKVVVIANDGQFHDDERIALNHAYKLYLAMKMQAGGGGGGHHHDH